MSDSDAIFDSFPYLITHSEEADLVRLLPAGHSEETLRFCAGCQVAQDGRPATLVLAQHRAVRLTPEDADEATVPALAERVLLGPDGCEFNFTETAELFSRYRHLRAWCAFHRAAALAQEAEGSRARLSFRAHSGVARRLQEISTANEVTRFLADVRRTQGKSAWMLGEESLREFLRAASWYDRLHDLWDAGLRQEWTIWLAEQAAALGLLPPDVAGEVEEILAGAEGGLRAARLLERFPGLFRIIETEQAVELKSA